MNAPLPMFCPSCGRRLGRIEGETRTCIRCHYAFDGVLCTNDHRHPFVGEADRCGT